MEVTELNYEDLEGLSDIQLRAAIEIYHRRVAPNSEKAVRDIMEGKDEEIFAALATPPYSYISEEIEIVNGLKVRYRSLFTAQIHDIHMATRKFTQKEDPSDVVAGLYLDRCFLAHGLETINGDYPGGQRLSDEWTNLSLMDPEKANEVLIKMREARVNLLNTMPHFLISRMSEGFQVFHGMIDTVTKSETIGELMGKSLSDQEDG